MPKPGQRSNATVQVRVLAAAAAGAIACALCIAFGLLRSGIGDRPALASGVATATPFVDAPAAAEQPDAADDGAAASPPAITRRYRAPGVTGPLVGEHPNLPLSPIQVAAGVIEPAHRLRRSAAEGTRAACQKYRTLAASGRDWDADVVLAIAWRESECNESAVSPTNDWGLLQLNATCWAGQAIDGLREVRSLPASVQPAYLQCDGNRQTSLAAQWCYRAKEAVFDTGKLPQSPCDAWLDPAVNFTTAYEIWKLRGWHPWCFNEASKSTPACEAAAQSSTT